MELVFVAPFNLFLFQPVDCTCSVQAAVVQINVQVAETLFNATFLPKLQNLNPCISLVVASGPARWWWRQKSYQVMDKVPQWHMRPSPTLSCLLRLLPSACSTYRCLFMALWQRWVGHWKVLTDTCSGFSFRFWNHVDCRLPLSNPPPPLLNCTNQSLIECRSKGTVRSPQLTPPLEFLVVHVLFPGGVKVEFLPQLHVEEDLYWSSRSTVSTGKIICWCLLEYVS